MENRPSEELECVLSKLEQFLQSEAEKANLFEIQALRRQLVLIRRAQKTDQQTAMKLAESLGLFASSTTYRAAG
jgi:hypothetical protein